MLKIINRLNLDTLKIEGPWGSVNDDKRSSKKPGKENDNKKGGDFDEAVKKFQDSLDGFFKNIKGSNGGGNSGGSRNSKNSNPQNSQNPQAKSLFGIIILGIIVLWMSMGFYKVDSDENAVVLYFGKFHSISTPGLGYRLPYPFSELIKKSVIKVNTEEFGSGFKSSNNSDGEFLMLSGDENIVDIDFQIQWQISDIEDFVFNISNTQIAIRKAAESAMREIIARSPIANALSDGKQKIEQDTKILLQEILDSYGAGVRIVLVQLLRVDPPKQVIDSFRDVQTAKADKEKEINQAQAYKNDIIPRARGEAVKLVQDAEAYRESVVADAAGQGNRFSAIQTEYSRAKVVTKRRIYLETMERIYEDMDKIIVDKSLSKPGIVPYLPLNAIQKKND